jgi:hypothetical protein
MLQPDVSIFLRPTRTTCDVFLDGGEREFARGRDGAVTFDITAHTVREERDWNSCG